MSALRLIYLLVALLTVGCINPDYCRVELRAIERLELSGGAHAEIDFVIYNPAAGEIELRGGEIEMVNGGEKLLTLSLEKPVVIAPWGEHAITSSWRVTIKDPALIFSGERLFSSRLVQRAELNFKLKVAVESHRRSLRIRDIPLSQFIENE